VKARYYCVVCGYKTLELYKEWDICPICFWEDDCLGEVDTRSPANGELWISQAQANFMRYGACDPAKRKYVRPPGPKDVRRPDFKPFDRAVEA
jgi:hypothetical protein